MWLCEVVIDTQAKLNKEERVQKASAKGEVLGIVYHAWVAGLLDASLESIDNERYLFIHPFDHSLM